MSAGDSAARTRDVARGLRLQLSPLLSPLPLGAPARINLTLTTGKREFVPRSIGFKSGHLTGFARWLDRSRAKPCRFRSLFRCTDFNEQLRPLDPGDGLVEAVTLLRGKGGALFPEPGRYEVVVWLDWADASGAPRSLTARTELTVADSTPPSDAARELRDNPNTLLALVIGGEDFHQAILPALADPILRPHYLIIEAKRLQRLGKTIEACQLLLDERAWLSGSEIGRLAEMLLPAKGAPKALREKVRAFLKKLAGAMPASVDDGVTSFLEQFIPP